MNLAVHVYRNRDDDERTSKDLHFCYACWGWYGITHLDSHCQQFLTAKFNSSSCACRICREENGKAIEGSYGFFTTASHWQPPVTMERVNV